MRFSFSVSIWKSNDEIITITENIIYVPKPECETIELTTRDEENKKMIHVVCLPENDYKLSMTRTAGLGGGWAVFDALINEKGVFDFEIHSWEYEISCARLGEFVADADNKCLKKIEIASGYESEYQKDLLQSFKEADERRRIYYTWMWVIVFCIGIVFFFARNKKHFFLTFLGVIIAEMLLHRNNIATVSIYGISPTSLMYVLVSSLIIFRITFKGLKTELIVSILPAIIYIAVMLIPFPSCRNDGSIFYASSNTCECVWFMKKQYKILSVAGVWNDASQCIGYANAACTQMNIGTGTQEDCNLLK